MQISIVLVCLLSFALFVQCQRETEAQDPIKGMFRGGFAKGFEEMNKYLKEGRLVKDLVDKPAQMIQKKLEGKGGIVFNTPQPLAIEEELTAIAEAFENEEYLVAGEKLKGVMEIFSKDSYIVHIIEEYAMFAEALYKSGFDLKLDVMT